VEKTLKKPQGNGKKKSASQKHKSVIGGQNPEKGGEVKRMEIFKDSKALPLKGQCSPNRDPVTGSLHAAREQQT